MARSVGPPPASRVPRSAFRSIVAALVVLTVGAALLGARPWAQPDRVWGGWQVADVPGTLIALLAVSTVVCLAVAAALTMHVAGLRATGAAGLTWLLIVLAAAGALVLNALVLAADAGSELGPVIPVLHWLFTLVPAVLAGAVARTRGAAGATTAALGTGVVTLPLFALGWALLHSREAFPGDVLATLWNSTFLGVLPLVLGVAIARNLGRSQEWQAHAR